MTVRERNGLSTPADPVTDKDLENLLSEPSQNVSDQSLDPLATLLKDAQNYWLEVWESRLSPLGLSIKIPRPEIPVNIRKRPFNGYIEEGSRTLEALLFQGDLGLLFIPKELADFDLLRRLGLVLPNCLTPTDAVFSNDDRSGWMITTEKPYPYKNQNALEQQESLTNDGFLSAGGLESLLTVGKNPKRYVNQGWSRVLGSRNSWDNRSFGFESMGVSPKGRSQVIITRMHNYLQRYPDVGILGVKNIT